MKILILEDEDRSGAYLQDLLQQHDPSIEVLARLPSVKKAAQWLKKNPEPDLIMMDIHLEDALVFQLFDEMTVTTPIIFTTAFDDYLVRAFKVNSIDYLLKPIQPADLAVALNKYKTLQKHFSQVDYKQLAQALGHTSAPAYKERFMISAGSKLLTVATKDIAYFILDSKVTHLVTDKGQRLVVNYSLDDLAQVLDPSLFFRINRQCVISLGAVVNAYVYSSGKLKVELQPASRQEMLVSGDRVAAFKEWLGK